MNGDLKQRIGIITEAKFDFLFASVAAFGGALVSFLFAETDTPRWLIGLSIFIWLLVLFSLIFYRAQREAIKTAKDSESAQAKLLQGKINAERRDEAINLTYRVINASTRSLRAITEGLKSSRTHPRKIPDEKASAEDYKSFKTRALRQLFADVRSVFEGDTRDVDTTNWPHNFFKIALFEPEPTPTDAALLRRTFFDYPEGIDPSPETDNFNIVEHYRAAVVLAFLQQSIVIIEDVKTENEKPTRSKRWMDRRDKQSQDYESMVCASIVSGIRGQPDRKCLGVLVIDTNRERYFEEDRSFQAFLGNLLNPFRTISTFILESKDFW